MSVSEHPEYSYHSTLEEKSSGSHHTATKIIRSRRKLQLCMKRSVSGGRICIRIYITCMCEKSSTMFFTMASKFGIEREYIGGLSKAKCLY